ncbi:Toll-like receptor 7 [Mactra antiquata]
MFIVQLLTLVNILDYCFVTADNSSCYAYEGRLTCNYIPVDIPNGILGIQIQNLLAEGDKFEIHDALFHGKNWKKILYLYINDHSGIELELKNNSMASLTKLKVLRINSDSKLSIEPDALLGLENINILDFTGCARLELGMIIKAINSSEKVPKLEQIRLSQVQYFWSGLNIDRNFSRCLSVKPLNTLDLSRTHIANFDCAMIKDMKYLKVLNLSKAIIDNYKNCHLLKTGDLNQLDIDISYVSTPMASNPFPTNTIANLNISIHTASGNLDLFFSPRIMNASGLFEGSDVRLYNIKLQTEINVKSSTTDFIFKQNKLKWFDVEFKCDNFDFTSIVVFDLAENGMAYFHPSWLTCLISLEHLNLKGNYLNLMQTEHVEQFGLLLNSSKRLTYINLAFNQLTDVPEDFFMGSKNLETILLAGNRLTQVHFNLHHLLCLRYIDLSNNYIRILDATSMKQLDTLIKDITPNAQIADTRKMTSDYSSGYRKVKIKGNPFECDSCNSRYSIHWLVSTSLTESTPSELTCKDESGTQINLNDAVNVIKDICERKKKIIVLTTTLVVGIALCVSVVLLIRTRRKRVLRQRRRNDVIEILRHDEDRFAVFLSFSNEDDEFVKTRVMEPLNEGLQRLLCTERNLICLGDSEFRLGQYVHNESLRCIELCTVFLCVVSENYCNSRYCVEEFNQASQMTTPVILMMKEEVDIDLMTPKMQLLFRNQVRMLWENNNGEYRLKTTWKNVCESIIDIATN